jgi:cyclopropane-fatty-acyl-phospholipid synthase
MCEAGFRFGSLVVFQIQLAKRVGTVPLTRDYMADRESSYGPLNNINSVAE